MNSLGVQPGEFLKFFNSVTPALAREAPGQYVRLVDLHCETNEPANLVRDFES
jgi:hypothetical protein